MLIDSQTAARTSSAQAAEKGSYRFMKMHYRRLASVVSIAAKSCRLAVLRPRLILAVLADLAILVGVSCPASFGQDSPGSASVSRSAGSAGLPKNHVNSDREDKPRTLRGRVVAVGIPGASAISAVGTFLPGGPIHDKPEFRAFTQPGRILDPARILVGSRSNFGAPIANLDQSEGSFLSIDPRGAETVVIPPDFASQDGQASTASGRVQLYTAQSPAFLNRIDNPAALTAGFTGASNPLGLSINNAFGRLWPANAPFELDGIGTSTILDPDGAGLAGAPNAEAGGVFAGDLTSRLPQQLIPGALNAGAVGTAFLGHSPDGSTRAVFSVVLADGSIVQEHTVRGVDGLAPPRTIAPLLNRDLQLRSAAAMATEQEDVPLDKDLSSTNANREDRDEVRVSPRLGVIFNWEPTRILFVSEPFENRIAVLNITDDDEVFHVADIRHFTSDALQEPIDLAPVTIESTDPNFSSNTTLDKNSDFYVANRGNNTIVRMRQDGTVVSVRRVRLPDGRSLGDARLNGIATSPDGTTIWVTVTGRLRGHEQRDGAVLALPTF
jgi:hypothetical protein